MTRSSPSPQEREIAAINEAIAVPQGNLVSEVIRALIEKVKPGLSRGVLCNLVNRQEVSAALNTIAMRKHSNIVHEQEKVLAAVAAMHSTHGTASYDESREITDAAIDDESTIIHSVCRELLRRKFQLTAEQANEVVSYEEVRQALVEKINKQEDCKRTIALMLYKAKNDVAAGLSDSGKSDSFGTKTARELNCFPGMAAYIDGLGIRAKDILEQHVRSALADRQPLSIDQLIFVLELNDKLDLQVHVEFTDTEVESILSTDPFSLPLHPNIRRGLSTETKGMNLKSIKQITQQTRQGIVDAKVGIGTAKVTSVEYVLQLLGLSLAEE